MRAEAKFLSGLTGLLKSSAPSFLELALEVSKSDAINRMQNTKLKSSTQITGTFAGDEKAVDSLC